MTMTPERKAEIHRLHAAASPGPWTYDETVGDVYAEKTDEIICSDVRNAPFIAAAITIVPELLAALEEAEKRTAEWEKNARTEYRIHNEVQDQLAEAKQTIARQQAAWDELKSIVSTNATGGHGEDINDYDVMLNIMGNIQGCCCSTPDIRTINNELVSNTSICVSCGKLMREGAQP